jgi:putative ABC transport system permease protein
MQTLWQDLRYGARILSKKYGFTLIAVITLALGIGANTAIFSVVNAVLLRPLPFNEPERVVMVWHKGAEAAGGDRTPLAIADLLDWRAQSHSFDAIAAFTYSSLNVTGRETPERVLGAGVTANFFAALGVEAALGRTFLPDEDRPGAGRVALLSDGYWRSRFGADPGVVGSAIRLDGDSYTVIGVAPPALNFPHKDVKLWTALQIETPTRRGPYFLQGVARLKPGVTLQQAYTDTHAIKSGFEGGNFGFNILPAPDYVVGDVRQSLVALLVAVTLVLLIAAVNVANLTLAESASRVKEISIRTSLGAARRRIIRQLMTESLLLALTGGALGIFAAVWGVDLLLKLAPEDIPRLEQIGIDGRALGWTALVSLLTGVVCGLRPAWQCSRLNLNEALKEGGRGSAEGAGQRRWRSSLVVVELALALTLLAGAGLQLKSLWRLWQVDLGVNPERVLTAYFDMPEQRYAQPQQFINFYERLLIGARALPGVRAAALSNSLPPDGAAFSDGFGIEGRPALPGQPPQIAYVIRVSPDYFRALGVALRSGRLFNAADTAESPRVALVNETLRRRFFPNEDPIGKRLNTGNDQRPIWNEIVGVIGDVKYNGLAVDVQPAYYQPLAQAQSSSVALILKTEAADPMSLTAATRDALNSVDSELPFAYVGTMEQLLASATAQTRFRATLFALFAALAVVLACVGVYGVISYAVANRTHEIGVRVALGAQSRDVLRMVLRQGLTLTLAGVGCGLLVSLALPRLMRGLLFNVSPTDPLTFVAISLLLIAVALVACWIPARRATKVDPMVALRCE